MIKLTWSPWHTNPLDFIHGRAKYKLATSDGKPVEISQSGNDFVVIIDGERFVTGGNVETCYLLNYYEVGAVK